MVISVLLHLGGGAQLNSRIKTIDDNLGTVEPQHDSVRAGSDGRTGGENFPKHDGLDARKYGLELGGVQTFNFVTGSLPGGSSGHLSRARSIPYRSRH